MSRVTSISSAMVCVVIALQPVFVCATDKPDRSESSSAYTVRDHRTRSNGQGGATVSNTPVVRDHRNPPVVRDHRNPPVIRDHRSEPIVRDHRVPTKVVDPSAKSRRPGKGPPIVRPTGPGRGNGKVVVRDHRDVPVIRDHRDTSGSPGGTKVTDRPIVRDHRDPPIVRDHRGSPIVRDHRTPGSVFDPLTKTRRPGKAPPTVRPIDPGRGDGKVGVRDPWVVRDHRDTSSNPGGTKVTNSPIIRDHR